MERLHSLESLAASRSSAIAFITDATSRLVTDAFRGAVLTVRSFGTMHESIHDREAVISYRLALSG